MQVGHRHGVAFVLYRHVVDARATAADQPARLAIAAGKPGQREQAERWNTGHKLVFVFGGTPDLIRQAVSGAPFDLGVVPIDVMKDPAARAKFGPTTNISSVGYGVAFKSGAPKPDVGTPLVMVTPAASLPALKPPMEIAPCATA